MSASIDIDVALGSVAPKVASKVASDTATWRASTVEADASLSHDLASHRGWRAWSHDWTEDSPSWLVSLILHLVGFLIVTSVAVPWMSQGQSGSGSISLTLGFADRSQQSQGPEVTITPTEATLESNTADSVRVGNQEPLSEDRARPRRPMRSAVSQQTKAAASAAPTPTRQPRSNETARLALANDKSFRISPYAALLNRRRPSYGTTTSQLQTVQPLSPQSLDPQQRAFDQVVDDFIAYDVGRLRGSAGMQARRRFAKLGPDALPALVRGLNKAAGIHASCPVGVIAGKLITTLRNASDPSLREYAINNIGVGVPEDAPHFHRLKVLREKWLGGPSMPPNVAMVIERLESRQEGEMMELMLALSDAPSDTVVAALRSGDEYLATAATLAIIQGPRTWDAQQRRLLRTAVAQFQTTAKNPQLRSLAGDAHRLLNR